ncbi:MAG TPA: gamma-glutamyltransferase family protein [Bryobacteraceae bacterium]|jgi:gamma-glutamyltranspeptidase/glutathione hydrolase|nr:gamma-glutamyltransferase family protein [Bryobacteraceae bacterium]
MSNPRASVLLVLASLPAFAQNPHTMFPTVRGTRQMIGAGNSMEVEAGYRILEQGGNAIDAGVASVLAAAVTEQDHFGLGGEMPLLVKMNGKPVMVVSGIGVAPKKATVEYYEKRPVEPWEQDGLRRPPIPGQGIRAAITPGMVDGLLLALENFGTKSFAEVAAPAIEDADTFPATEIFSNTLGMFQRILALWPASQQFYFPKGTLPKPGEIVHMPNLAATLREMAAAEKKAHGNRVAKLRAVHDIFYKGDIAKRIASFNEQNGGLIAYDDLANFHAELDQARSTSYRGYVVNKPGFFTQGPVMIEALNILEGYDLKAMGHNTPEYLHIVIEAVKLAFADRDRYYGDPKFSKIPEEILLSKEYAARRRKQIDPEHASLESRPGDLGASAPMTGGGGNSKDRDTTCVDVFDKFGNAFSATPSGAWLPSVIAGDTGIPLSIRLSSFVMTPGHANQLAPGKRPRVTLSPTLVTKDGDFYMELSTPGGDNQDQALLQVLLNIIDFGMTPQEAVESPRFQTEHFYASFDFHEFAPGRVSLEGRLSRDTIQRMIALGHRVQVGGEWSNTSAPVVIQRKDGVLNGAADPRRGRFLFGK